MIDVKGGFALQDVVKRYMMSFCVLAIKRFVFSFNCPTQIIILRFPFLGWTRLVSRRLRGTFNVDIGWTKDFDRTGFVGHWMRKGTSAWRLHKHSKICAVD